ncbi:hypothetical protein [Moorena producens]|nr:hypothetical protein [Moorena producens]
MGRWGAVRPVANLIRLAMQRGLGEAARSWGSPRRRNLITLSLYG